MFEVIVTKFGDGEMVKNIVKVLSPISVSVSTCKVK